MRLEDFDKLVIKYQEQIYWHIRRMVVRHDDAQDILQDTFLRAYNKVGSLKDPEAFRPWLYKIATTQSLNFLRSRRDEHQGLEILSTVAADPYIDYDRKALVNFQKALQGLSPQERAVFTMRYWDELPYEEIAQALDTTVGSAKVSYHNAKEKVKQFITSDDE